MTQIEGSRDCGNSPKNRFVQDAAIALECGEAEAAIFGEDVAWELPSSEWITGREAVLAQVGSQPRPASLVVHHAISHGKVGAASGEVTLADGQIRRFCHVFEFTSAKGDRIAAVRSYA